MHPRPLRVAALAAIVLAIAASPLPRQAAAGSAETALLRVMTLNVFYGADELDLHTGSWCHRPAGCPETMEAVVAAIRSSGADVVGLEEAEHSTRAIADALGWHASERTQVISRLPIVDPPGADGVYVWIEAAPGRFVAIANVHLPSDPYGPYAIRDGASLTDVLALEAATRVPALADQLAILPDLAAGGMPVFLTGDFNSPSHLDWTAAVAAARPDVPFPVDWPVGTVLADAGFRDSYRAVHPDPIARPGYTWTPGGPESDPREVHDRIDWVLAAGPATAVASDVVGEAGHPDVDISSEPWPTDHRGVVTTFVVEPTAVPDFVAVESRRLTAGDLVSVRFQASAGGDQAVALVAAGDPPSEAVDLRAVGSAGGTAGLATFATAGLAPGAYETVLTTGGTEVSRSPFWLYAPGEGASAWTDSAVYTVGEPIVVSWSGAPGMRWDWLGVYAPGRASDSPVARACNAGCAANGRYLAYVYTRTAIEGSAIFDEASQPGVMSWPLKPGTYAIRLLVDDGYQSVATSAAFRIVKP